MLYRMNALLNDPIPTLMLALHVTKMQPFNVYNGRHELHVFLLIYELHTTPQRSISGSSNLARP
jgi:hypothetical protein